MHESADELATLQQLLDDSFEKSSDHLRSIMEPQRRLSAQRLSAELPSRAVLNVATVTAQGEPRISAVDGHFLHGYWYFSTLPEAMKTRQLVARPGVSASYTPKDGYGVFCHGQAVLLEGAEHQALVEQLAVAYATEPEVWADVAGFRIDPHWMTAFAMTDEDMVEIEAQNARIAAQNER